MPKLFIAILLLVFLSACSMEASAVTPSVRDIQSPLPAASATATSLFDTVNHGLASTSTPSIVTATGQAQMTPPLPTLSFNVTPDPTLIPTVSVSCPAPVPHVQISQQVTVIVEDWDKLKLRSKASLSEDTVLMELDKYTQLKILDGPVCFTDTGTEVAYLFWKVAIIPSGEIGWVAEGDIWHYFFY